MKGLLIKINYRESLLEETEEDYYRRLALFALRNHGGEDAINVIIESLGVESSMIRIEVNQIFMYILMTLSLSHCSLTQNAFCFCFFLGCICVGTIGIQNSYSFSKQDLERCEGAPHGSSRGCKSPWFHCRYIPRSYHNFVSLINYSLTFFGFFFR